MEQIYERESQVPIGRVLGNIPNVILVLDQELHIVYANKTAGQITGDPMNAIIGLLDSEVGDSMKISENSPLRHIIERTVLTGEDQSSIEVIRSNHSTAAQTIHVSTVYQETDSLLFAMLEDITGLRLKNTTANMKEVIGEVLDAAGRICHDINQPLQVATGSLDLALLMFDGSDKNRKLINDARKQMNHVAEIARKIMGLRGEYLSDNRVYDDKNRI